MSMLHVPLKKEPSWWSSTGLHFFFLCVNWMDLGDNNVGFHTIAFWFQIWFIFETKEKAKINEHFISLQRQMMTNNRHMIIMTLSVHNLIAAYHMMVSMKWAWMKRPKNSKISVKITKSSIWWDRWNDNNFCYCYHFEMAALSLLFLSSSKTDLTISFEIKKSGGNKKAIHHWILNVCTDWQKKALWPLIVLSKKVSLVNNTNNKLQTHSVIFASCYLHFISLSEFCFNHITIFGHIRHMIGRCECDQISNASRERKTAMKQMYRIAIS